MTRINHDARAADDKVAANSRLPTSHTCHWPGCETRIAGAYWACREHWYLIPWGIRQEIWRTYRASQEAAGGPALTDYALIATEALDWIKANGKAAIKRRAARRART